MDPVDRFDQVAPQWLVAALSTLSYATPLPIQRVVLPQVCAALASGIHMDVCLTAPTGAGKTLCYALPMVRHVAAMKATYGDIQIRGVVLVPTKALGRQVAAIITSLAATQGIAVGLCCGDEREDTELTRRVALCGSQSRTFSAVDIVVATPQKFMKELVLARVATGEIDGPDTESLLRFVELLVIDEADDILTGIFTNFACRIAAAVDAAVAAAASKRPVHRLLCSATLTARIANISELRLKNAKSYALDAAGIQDEAAASGDTVNQAGRVRSTIALPAALQEHVVIVRQEEKRHAVLLNVLRKVIDQQKSEQPATEAPGAEGVASASTVAVRRSTILVFVSTTDQARVLSHFITKAGMRALEFTAATTEAERRSAVIDAYSGANCVVIATDALMRGIDLPGVSAVVMYDAPRTLQQYVHRIGRTARAGNAGKSYVLVSREGPSGTLADGEVAIFKSFDAFLKRHLPVIHEFDLRDVDGVLDEANRLLEQAKGSLQKGWASAATVATATATKKALQQQADAKAARARQPAAAISGGGEKRHRREGPSPTKQEPVTAAS